MQRLFTHSISRPTPFARYTAIRNYSGSGFAVLMYWIGRVMLFAQRGLIHDDPIVFALKDRVSWGILAAFSSIMLFAL